MTELPIPLPILYAGLGGTLLALIVATAQNQWSPRVFFLLALRLAIGWHFLFEGLHKIHTHAVGPSETNRPFSSEPYFKVAPGPVGGFMRKQFDDPEAAIAAKVKPAKEYTPVAFAKLSADEQAAACPEAVGKDLDALAEKTEEAIKAEAAADLKAADAGEEKGLKDAKTDADKAAAKEKAGKDRQAAQKKAESFKEAAPTLITAAKATYARWVYGVDGRDTKVKGITGDAKLSAPERLTHLQWLRDRVRAGDDERAAGLGNGYGIEQKRAAELRTELVAAETDLAKDATAFVAELKAELTGGKADEEPAPVSRGKRMDKMTMWFLVVVGGCLMAGLLTRVACVLGAGFLVVTYLAHPPFPWYTLPPGTEGNPLFVNKNAIECLALLALASMPTGRWLGLDALLMRAVCGRPAEHPAAT